jgi:hypothetical protein
MGLSSQSARLWGRQVTLRRRAAHKVGEGNKTDHAHDKDRQDVAWCELRRGYEWPQDQYKDQSDE